MSGIAGILDTLDGLTTRSVDLDLLQRMAGRLEHRGPDGISFWSGGPVGLAFAAMHTTPESRLENQPHGDDAGMCRLVFDGRLDDRATLRQQLVEQGQRPREDTDAELALRSYLVWGESCATHLIGDFALALWDGRRKQLYCARDILGLRPFYYSAGASQFLFASEPRAILESQDVSTEPDAHAVAGHIACLFENNEETLFKEIRRLPPAHYIVMNGRELRIGRYWSPSPERRVRYSTDAQYAEHFLDLLQTVVSSHLRSNGPVGALVSGGLDSSAVVSVALDLQRRAGGAQATLESFGMVFPGEICDESDYLLELEEFLNYPITKVELGQVDPSRYARQAARDWEFPGNPNGDMLMGPAMNQARARGIRVLLMGMGGDEWFTGSRVHYADYLRDGRIIPLLRQWNAERRSTHHDNRIAAVPMGSLSLLRHAVWPLLSQPARNRIKWLLGRKSVPDRRLVSETFWQLAQASRRPPLTQRAYAEFPTLTQRDMVRMLDSPWSIQILEVFERNNAQLGIEVRSPFQDRRMIEFGLALPEEQRWRGPWTKFVMREAMRGRLPERLRQRLTKAEFSIPMMESLLILERDGLFANMETVKIGWVDQERLVKSWRELKSLYERDVDLYTLKIWPLWMTAGVELWARALRASRE